MDYPIKTADEGWIEMKLDGPIPFIVSLNSDHDGGKRDQDKDLAAPPPFEDNLRELRFFATDAAWIQVLSPMTDEATPRDAVAIGLMRAWDKDKKPFKFGPLLPTDPSSPLIAYFEGRKTSPKQDYIVFEYQYYDKNQKPLTDKNSTGQCTVVNVTFSGNGRTSGLTKNQKLLATGVLTTTATITPPINNATYQWSYDDPTNAEFDPATGRQKSSKLTATSHYTDEHVQDGDKVRFSVTDPRQVGGPITIFEPLNITAPRGVDADPSPLKPQSEVVSTKGIVNKKEADDALFHLFRWKVKYTVKDQFSGDIHESDFGGAKVQVREDVHVTSPFGALQTWFAASLTTPDWKNIKDDGTFTDTLGSDRAGIPMSAIMSLTPGAIGLRTTTVGQTIVSIEHHTWHVTVDKDQPGLDKKVTDNWLETKTTNYSKDTQGYEVAEYESRYGLVLT